MLDKKHGFIITDLIGERVRDKDPQPDEKKNTYTIRAITTAQHHGTEALSVTFQCDQDNRLFVDWIDKYIVIENPIDKEKG